MQQLKMVKVGRVKETAVNFTSEVRGKETDAERKLEQLQLILTLGLDVFETFDAMVAVIISPPFHAGGHRPV